MSSLQSVFAFDHKPAYGKDLFFESPSNLEALGYIRQGPQTLLIQGPRFCGKTHLLHIWCTHNQGKLLKAETLDTIDLTDLLAHSLPIAVDDIDHLTPHAQEVLFHLYNHQKKQNKPLLLTAQFLNLEGALKDLSSRLKAITRTVISNPDEPLIEAILIKRFADLQLQVSPQVIPYLVPRLERTFEAIQKCLVSLDRLSLAQKRQITLSLVKEANI